ncbi:hypothetical protein [Aquimarina sp. MAR_2010_214]|uniref:hypothetical protein n=1 Tax=Aquimarina sp. MAR_2010_214 TaxID=1250026 RepID=UPI001178A26C|nr:hypothetical protein [Aquimarina sp. MAR_2010_214]
MKKINLTPVILFAAFALALSSCNKDDDAVPVVTPEGTENISLSLSKGYTEDLGEDINAFNIEIFLVSNEMTFNTDSGEFQGNGTVLEFDFHSSTNTLAAGTYSFEDYTTDRSALKFDGDIDITNGKGFSIKGGTVKISYDGDQTVLEYDLILDSINTDKNSTTKGSFKGLLAIIE